LPTKDAPSVRESGKPAAAAPGVTVLGARGDRAVFRLEPGRYSFDAAH
jgi:hypothetical protein